MNFDFVNVGEIVHKGVPCFVQKAVAPWNARGFWITWKTCNDKRLKDSIMIRREGDRMILHRMIPQDATIKLPPIPMPYVMKKYSHLLDYQPDAVALVTRSVINNGCGIDGSDTGLGKTFVALGVCQQLRLRPGIVCKKAGIAGWKRACAYMGIEPLFIINWESARTGKFIYAPRKHHDYEPRWIYKWKLPKEGILIFDECHVACHEDSLNNQLWTSAKGIRGMYLSATFSDRPVRLASLADMLGICTLDQFTAWLKARGNFTNQRHELESLSPVQDMKEIHKLLYPRYGVRLSYGDPAVKKHFPGVVHQVMLITMDDNLQRAQNKAYVDFVKQAAEYKEAGKKHTDSLVAELRYRQSAEILKVPTLAEYAQDYMSEGLSVCIFVNYRATLAALAKVLNTRSLIFGDQDKMKISREDVIADFQANRSRIILLMSDAGGQSIDLHDLHGGHQRISMICPTYNPITLKQVMGRTHRAKSKTIPIIKLVYSAGTVEEKVAESVAGKLDNIEALNKGDLMESDIFNIQGRA